MKDHKKSHLNIDVLKIKMISKVDCRQKARPRRQFLESAFMQIRNEFDLERKP